MASTWDNGFWDVGFWDESGGPLRYKKMKVKLSLGTLSGLATGKVFLRVCARGADAQNGPWSDLAEEMVR